MTGRMPATGDREIAGGGQKRARRSARDGGYLKEEIEIMSLERPDQRASRRRPLSTDAELEQVLDELKEYFHGRPTEGDELPPAAGERQPRRSSHDWRFSGEQSVSPLMARRRNGDSA